MSAIPESAYEKAIEAAHAAWPTDSHYVAEWHPEDADIYRNKPGSMDERQALIDSARQARVVRAVLDAAAPGIERAAKAEALRDAAALSATWRTHGWLRRRADEIEAS